MSEAIRLLHALAHALSTLALYAPGHPATRRAIEQAHQALASLLGVDLRPTFLFLGGAPIYEGRALHELRDWPWSRRLSDAGVQRVEFDDRLTIEGMTAFLDRVMVQLNSGPAANEGLDPIEGVIYGPVTILEEAEPEEADPVEREVEGSRERQLDLSDELAAVGHILAEASSGALARAEAEAVVRILNGLLDEHALPQATHGSAPYPVVHAVNTALLVMSAAIATGMDRAHRQRLGVAALLHDIGMAMLPRELVDKEMLTVEERERMESHTVRGARLLLEGGTGMALASTVAYEHHLRPDGTGYPAGRLRVTPHWASRLVGAASAFVSLRSPRPFRPPWTPQRAVLYLEDGAGTVFDDEVARLLATVVRPA